MSKLVTTKNELNNLMCLEETPVGMDEVVSAYVSRYETNLTNAQKELKEKITANRKDQKAFKEATEKSYRAKADKQYNNAKHKSYGPLKIRTLVKDTKVEWSYVERNSSIKTIRTTVDIYANGGSDRTGYVHLHSSLTATEINSTINFAKIESSLSEELMEINRLLQDVSRKERQVRGKIAERKLETAGINLELDNEILKLVTL